MPSIRFLASECHTYIVTLILLLSVIMPTYSCYTKKKLVCVIITAPSSRQPFSYSKCTKLNMRSFCNIKSVSNAEYIFLAHFYSL